MTEPSLPPSRNSPFAVIGAGIVGLVLLVALLVGFHGDDLPVILPSLEQTEAVPPPPLEHPPAPRWADESGINLPPLGTLPSLQTAARTNPTLRRALNEFSQKSDAELFADFARTDADITAILLLWAGADLDRSERMRDGTDRRVAVFLQRVYGLSTGASVANHPRLGRDPWPRLFAQHKVRLIAQAKGGSAPFTGTLRYNIARDRVELQGGGLNRRFFADFGNFVRGRRNADALRNNLLSYVRAIDASLLERDAQTASLLR